MVGKKINFLVIIFFLISHSISAEEITLIGVYQGKNIYVQNPLSDDMVSFCTNSVYVNDLLIISSPKTSAYEIDLSGLNLSDPVVIRIVHKGSCHPKVINPQVIRPKSQFQFVSLFVDAKSIRWFTKGEKEAGKFFIEQYLNNKWVIIKTVDSKGSFDQNQYQVDAIHQSGLNRYRIKYLAETGNTYYSKVDEFFSEKEPVTFYPTRVTDKITLSQETTYEVLDAQGIRMNNIYSYHIVKVILNRQN